jgi:hypothetical protein
MMTMITTAASIFVLDPVFFSLIFPFTLRSRKLENPACGVLGSFLDEKSQSWIYKPNFLLGTKSFRPYIGPDGAEARANNISIIAQSLRGSSRTQPMALHKLLSCSSFLHKM